jgi:hypothetical protein
LLNVVVAQVAFGLKIITPFGTGAENALEVMVEQLKLIVAPVLGIPLAWIWALNQMVSPAGMAVPLKFDWIDDVGHGGHGVGVGVGVGVGKQFMVSVVWPLGQMIGMVFSPTKVAFPENVRTAQGRCGTNSVSVVVKVPLGEAVKGTE